MQCFYGRFYSEIKGWETDFRVVNGKKALEINAKLDSPKDFKARTGWLKNFKSQHGISELQIDREILSCKISTG